MARAQVDHRRRRRRHDAGAPGTDLTSAPVIDAGAFGTWLAGARAMLQGGESLDVPCGDCRGCCRSSYFIPVRPTDTQAIAVIPAELLTIAPGTARGQRVMGYRADGSCPMFDGRDCSIYPQRPQTCRDYDCRVFAAAGIAAGGDDKTEINARVRAWQFSYASDADAQAHRAVQAAADFIRSSGATFPAGRAPTAPTGVAVLALKVYEEFLEPQDPDRADAQRVVDLIARWQAFDRGASLDEVNSGASHAVPG